MLGIPEGVEFTEASKRALERITKKENKNKDDDKNNKCNHKS